MLALLPAVDRLPLGHVPEREASTSVEEPRERIYAIRRTSRGTRWHVKAVICKKNEPGIWQFPSAEAGLCPQKSLI